MVRGSWILDKSPAATNMAGFNLLQFHASPWVSGCIMQVHCQNMQTAANRAISGFVTAIPLSWIAVSYIPPKFLSRSFEVVVLAYLRCGRHWRNANRVFWIRVGCNLHVLLLEMGFCFVWFDSIISLISPIDWLKWPSRGPRVASIWTLRSVPEAQIVSKSIPLFFVDPVVGTIFIPTLNSKAHLRRAWRLEN